MNRLVMLAGLAQVGLSLGSLVIPLLLGWREELKRLSPLTRQVFWTYAGYIFSIDLVFGILSAVAPALLTDGSPLAAFICAFNALYWGARLVIQFSYFDRSSVPVRAIFKLGEVALVTLFIFFTALYGFVAYTNLS